MCKEREDRSFFNNLSRRHEVKRLLGGASSFLHLFSRLVLRGRCVEKLRAGRGRWAGMNQPEQRLPSKILWSRRPGLKGARSKSLGSQKRAPSPPSGRMRGYLKPWTPAVGFEIWTFMCRGRSFRNRRFQLFFKNEPKLKAQGLVERLRRTRAPGPCPMGLWLPGPDGRFIQEQCTPGAGTRDTEGAGVRLTHTEAGVVKSSLRTEGDVSPPSPLPPQQAAVGTSSLEYFPRTALIKCHKQEA